MLRCTQCGSEDEFEVDEMCRHIIRIQSGADWEYTFIDEEEFIEVHSWGDVTCLHCETIQDSEDAKAAYDAAHGEDTPIPYTLDASVS